jgi:hypothetical protein
MLLQGLASAVLLWSESHGTQDHILLSQFFRLPQPGGPGPRIYIPQEQGGPVIPLGTGFPFCRLLQLAELRWRYSNPPRHGSQDCNSNGLQVYNLDADRIEITSSDNFNNCCCCLCRRGNQQTRDVYRAVP